MLFRYRQLSPLHHLLRERGADANGLFRSAGFDPPEEDAMVEVELDRLEALHHAAGAATGGSAIGLEVALSLDRGRFGWVEFAMRCAATFDEAVGLLVRYGALINPGATFAFRPAEGVLEYQVRREGGLGPHLNEFTLTYLLRAFHEGTGSEWAPIRVVFAHESPTNLRALEHFFRCPLVFGASCSSLEVPSDVRSRRLPGADHALHQLLRQRLAELLPSAPTRAWAARVEGALLSRLGLADASLQGTARALGTSARSLQRSLAEEGTTFNAVADRVRRVLIDEMLAKPNLAIEEIAILTGYSDVRALDRAYKRWTGTTPRAMRQSKLVQRTT